MEFALAVVGEDSEIGAKVKAGRGADRIRAASRGVLLINALLLPRDHDAGAYDERRTHRFSASGFGYAMRDHKKLTQTRPLGDQAP